MALWDWLDSLPIFDLPPQEHLEQCHSHQHVCGQLDRDADQSSGGLPLCASQAVRSQPQCPPAERDQGESTFVVGDLTVRLNQRTWSFGITREITGLSIVPTWQHNRENRS